MSRQIIKTKAWVLSNRPYKEADLMLKIFTRSFGVLWAKASGVRYLKSKLRYATQPFSLLNVELVQIADGWRLTNANTSHNFYLDAPKRVQHKVSKVFSIIEDLFIGEVNHPEIFDDFTEGIKSLSDGLSTEALIAMKVLNHLGYVEPKDVPENLLSLSYDIQSEQKILDNIESINNIISKGLSASGLQKVYN